MREVHAAFKQQIVWILDEIFADKIPTCEKDSCDGVVKPGTGKDCG
jgi:hypothetical protein